MREEDMRIRSMLESTDVEVQKLGAMILIASHKGFIEKSSCKYHISNTNLLKVYLFQDKALIEESNGYHVIDAFIARRIVHNYGRRHIINLDNDTEGN